MITDLSSDWLNGEITSVIIEDGVKEIGSDAFAMTSGLKEVTVPASVTSVGSGAFANQFASGVGGIFGYEKKVAITYNGTWAEWLTICEGGWDKGLAKGSTVICDDGTYAKTEGAWYSGDRYWKKQ